MTEAEPKIDPRFTPYQADFFRRFIAEVGPGSAHLLVSPVGTGKSFAIAGTISELVRTGRSLRTLILAPAALVAQWAHRLGDLGRDPVVLDGRALRLLREGIGDAAGNWPEGVYAMSIDLAKRADVQDLIVGFSWNLVAVDDAHSLAGERLRLVERISSAKPPPAVLLITHARGPGIDTFASSARLLDWTEAVAAFFAGDAAGPQLAREVRTYRRSSEEIAVAERVLDAARQLEQMKAMVLVQRAASSVRSLEDSLVRWLESGEETADRDVLEPLLGAVEELRGDSKLDCFGQLVRGLLGSRIRHVVVFCEYRTTMEYIAAGVEGLGAAVYQFHGGLRSEQRSELFNVFTSQGGILITTSASEGVSLNFVEAVVHYDLPFSGVAFAAREGRYHRYGRRQPCTVYFLKDETDALPVEELLHRVVQKFGVVSAEIGDDVESLVHEMLPASHAGTGRDPEGAR
jgi:superfamily II DNA or RNA helicase